MRAAGLVVLSGCSIAMTSRPAEIARGDVPTCETTRSPVVVDTVASILPIAVGGMLTYIGLANRHDPNSVNGNNLGLDYGVPTLAIGFGFVSSAIYGVINTAACTDQIDAALAEVARDAAAGDCEPVIAFATQLVRRDRRAAVLLIQNPAVAKCLSSREQPGDAGERD